MVGAINRTQARDFCGRFNCAPDKNTERGGIGDGGAAVAAAVGEGVPSQAVVRQGGRAGAIGGGGGGPEGAGAAGDHREQPQRDVHRGPGTLSGSEGHREGGMFKRHVDPPTLIPGRLVGQSNWLMVETNLKQFDRTPQKKTCPRTFPS